MTREFKRAIIVLALLCVPGFSGVARAESQDEQIRQLKETLEQLQKTINEQNKQMQKTIDEQNRKIQEIEKAQAKAPPPPPPAMPEIAAAIAGATSPVTERGTFKDRAASRAASRRSHARPEVSRLHAHSEHQGADQVQRQAAHRHDVRQPECRRRQPLHHRQDPRRGRSDTGRQTGRSTSTPRARSCASTCAPPRSPARPRFYYENDFYGSGGGEFPYRLRHLYGQIYNVIVGQTFSVFEDPDVWPDTVDYEGPNSAIFARRPLMRYQHRLNDEWQLNVGVEQPEAEIDTTTRAQCEWPQSAPDGGLNVRWERSGHRPRAVRVDVARHRCQRFRPSATRTCSAGA